jgi:hypothetical protein
MAVPFRRIVGSLSARDEMGDTAPGAPPILPGRRAPILSQI